MKFRCPYCKETYEGKPRAVCPHCKKGMMIPNRLQERSFRQRKRGHEDIARQAERQRQAIMDVPDFLLHRKPSHLFLMLGVMVVVGAMVLAGANKAFKPRAVRTKFTVAAKALKALRIAVERFHRDLERYPTTEEGLKVLVINPGTRRWKGHYVSLVKPDPWLTNYHYELTTSNTVVLFSYGPDKTMGTEDDIYPADFTTEELYADRIRKTPQKK
jgi:general secretion pathway protein G